MIKICHITSVHESDDIRIFRKECYSLAAVGYETYLVAGGESREENGVHVIGLGVVPKSRIKRMFSFAKQTYKMALNLDCDVYHFHDPELLPYGLKLKKKGKKVIFDSHEDVAAQIEDKEWIPRVLRKTTSRVYRRYETHAVKHLDAVVAATSHIADMFSGRARKIVVVNNYPKLDDIVFHDTPFCQREPIVCYAGGISEMRGEKVMIEAMNGLDATLILAGPHGKSEIVNTEGNRNYSFIGVINRETINELYERAVVGLVLLLPKKNYVESLPIKMFEYMAAGIPFVASDFPLWVQIAKETKAGICVDVNNVRKVRETIRFLIDNREMAMEMGKNGRQMIEQKYNWIYSEQSLLELYSGL